MTPPRRGNPRRGSVLQRGTDLLDDMFFRRSLCCVCAGWERGAPPSAATPAVGEPPLSPAPEAGGAEDGFSLGGVSFTLLLVCLSSVTCDFASAQQAGRRLGQLGSAGGAISGADRRRL